jgi:hypothetical protein
MQFVEANKMFAVNREENALLRNGKREDFIIREG